MDNASDTQPNYPHARSLLGAAVPLIAGPSMPSASHGFGSYFQRLVGASVHPNPTRRCASSSLVVMPQAINYYPYDYPRPASLAYYLRGNSLFRCTLTTISTSITSYPLSLCTITPLRLPLALVSCQLSPRSPTPVYWHSHPRQVRNAV